VASTSALDTVGDALTPQQFTEKIEQPQPQLGTFFAALINKFTDLQAICRK
jgi:hypothetical protein